MSVIPLESDRMRVELDPAFGARVTALWDKRAGREWLVTGPREGGADDDAEYGGAQARGWDECFPTVSPCAHPAWGPLRDHGLLWGRPWVAVAHGPTARCTYRDDRFAFRRMLDLHGATLDVLYEVENLTDAPLPFLWSQHCLLAARPGERIVVEGADGWDGEGGAFGWPRHPWRDLSTVGAVEEGFSLKAYAEAGPEVRAGVEGENGGIRFAWRGADVPCLGLWLDWGGWPGGRWGGDGPGVHQMAVEPATAPADDLATAEAMGRAAVLAPGATASWRLSITLTDPA